ncbi:Uncharacterised protein [BD1-7 clade bacterium]|uniref:Uncharacterized protein n=1 Tax=BD1-7 clade bacterium TaxID=2029982 RepID=A0A5S9PC13_9GAMM|nr:Uncharacterised protein [BD1-7 clade bacterium]CAA0101380.1 Uncharacterised protein [BD1-7 clade bacterium]
MSGYDVSYLPYNLPANSSAQALRLAEILQIEPAVVAGISEHDVTAISSVILYRHLDRFQKMEVMSQIHAIENRRLAGKLQSKVVDTLVNPQWGIWSLSNEELLADQAFHTAVDELASLLGLSASALGGKDLIEELWKQRKAGKASIAVIVIWGAVYFNKRELIKANTEVSNRSQLQSSPHY